MKIGIDLQKSGGDDSSGCRSTVNMDQSSTTNVTLDGSGARKTAADDTSACGTDEFDVYTIETALPHVEWERLEQSLRMSAAREQTNRWVS